MLSFPRSVCLLLATLLCSYLPAGEAEGKPDMPQNLIVTPQGPSIMIMKWSRPSSAEVDHYFVYVEGEDLKDTTIAEYYIWEGLEGCTTYTFGVKTVSSSGSESDPTVADGRTDVSYPPEPQDLHVVNYTYDTVTLAWRKPATQCDIEKYRVTCQEEGSQPAETVVNETTVEVSQLTPETLYTFSVYASTSEGEGPAASISQTTTTARPPEGKPDMPQNLEVMPEGPSMMLMMWSKPSSIEVDCYYFVYVEGEDLNATTFDEYYIWEGLEDCTNYTFGVKTVSSGESDPAVADGETNVGYPPEPQDLHVMNYTYDTVTLAWRKPATQCDIEKYRVICQEEGSQPAETIVNETTVEVSQLTPETLYTFSVYASTSEGEGPAASISQTTTTADPPEPQDLHVMNYTYDTVTLAWRKPATQCDIEKYRVTCQEEGSQPAETVVNETTVEVSQLTPETLYTFSVYASTSEGEGPAASISQTTTTAPGPPQNLVAEGINSSAINVSWSEPNLPPSYYLLTDYHNNIDVRIFGLQFMIVELEPCMTLDITVSSYYEDIEKKFPATTRGKTTVGVPPEPQNCSVDVADNYITVNWEKPKTSCKIETYIVNWTIKKLWGSGEEESNGIETRGLSHTENNPPPYHRYTFEIAASVEGIVGDAISCSGTTLETNAGPPVLVSLVSEEQGEVRVTWEPPAEENGNITHYGIYLNDADDYVKEVSEEVRTTTVTLEACVSVDISVAARNGAVKNDGWGERSEAKNVTPAGDALPEQMDCLQHGPDLLACWLPYSTDCPVSQYNLQWEGHVLWSPGATDSNSTTLGWSRDEICYNIPSIPYTKYTVSLNVGINAGKPITCSSTTPMAAPGPPTLEKLQVENFTISVTWKEPLEKNGIISNYRVEWTDWNGRVDSQVTDKNTFSYQIMENSCGGEVDVTVSAKTTDFDEFGERSPPESVLLVNSISSLTCETTEPGEVALNWELQELNCPVNLYNVTWSFTSLWSEDKGSDSKSLIGNVSSDTLEHLKPYSEVSVAIYVDNSTQPANCTTTTQEEVSDPPTNLRQTANNSHSATVAWDSPESVRGKLSSWHLNWTTENGNLVGEQDVSATIKTFQIEGLSSSWTYVVSVMAVNGAGRGKPSNTNVKTAYVPKETPLGLILGLSIGGGVLLILLAIGGFVVYWKKHQTKPPRPAPFMPNVIDSDNDKLYKRQHQSSANQRFQGEGETIDSGTNRELYPDDNMETEPPNETCNDDDTVNEQFTVPENINNILEEAVDRRLSQQVSSNLDHKAVFNRRPSQLVNIRMNSFEEYNKHSSHPNIAAASEHDRRPSHHESRSRSNMREFGRRPSQQVDLGKPNLMEYGRRPSQQIDVGGHNLNEFGRRPSQQIDEHRPRTMEHGRRFSQQIEPGKQRLGEYGRRPPQQGELGRPNLREYGRRPSQQVDLGRPNLREYGRRPSQQVDLGRPNLREYGRRPSQQIDLGRPNLREYERRSSQQIELKRPRQEEFARRPSQQVGISGRSLPSRAPQQPIPPRLDYGDYTRRPSQQTDIGLPSDRAFMRRPSQQFVMNFEGIKE
ncbi:phosphatidylinositol phosphatase PTPRQ-like isoform X2 [Scylla paramamosain]|uniref:phosphatidylinositol phosphatase PTPRQ-like isoform X2 n=1 Tax=Scylla paramamosain TaxID=85552 RepID=UPI0030833AFD